MLSRSPNRSIFLVASFRHRALCKVSDPTPAYARNFQSTLDLIAHMMLYVSTDAFSKVSRPASRFEPSRVKN